MSWLTCQFLAVKSYVNPANWEKQCCTLLWALVSSLTIQQSTQTSWAFQTNEARITSYQQLFVKPTGIQKPKSPPGKNGGYKHTLTWSSARHPVLAEENHNVWGFVRCKNSKGLCVVEHSKGRWKAEPSLRFLSHFVTLDFYLILRVCLKHHNGKPLKYFKQGIGNLKILQIFFAWYLS